MADLLELRKQLVRLSGDRSLVVDAEGGDFDDAKTASGLLVGANYYINRGIRMLDRLQEHPQSLAWYDHDPTLNDAYVTMSGLRFAKEVWYVDADGGRTLVDNLRFEDFFDLYGDAISTVDAGKPTHWCFGQFNRAPVKITTALASYGTGRLVQNDPTGTEGIFFHPKSDATYSFHILGAFYSATLSNDTDQNYWSVAHEELVIAAARYQLEAMRKNQEGMNDLMAYIKHELHEIDLDLAERDAAGIEGIIN